LVIADVLLMPSVDSKARKDTLEGMGSWDLPRRVTEGMKTEIIDS